MKMRRLLSFTLLLALGLPLLAAVFGSAQAESQLPMCCRRAGVHHCAEMKSAMAMDSDTNKPVLRMACSAFPHTLGQVHTGGWFFWTEAIVAEIIPIEQAKVRQVEAGYRISQGRSRHKRGPPVEHIS